MKVRDIMTTEVVTLKVDEELSLASDIMTLARIRHLPIVEGDRLIGIISQRDLFKASLASVINYDYQATRTHLKAVTIKEIMVKNIVTIAPDAKIHAAGRIMLEKKIGCLPVVKDDALVGMVTESDIMEFYVSRQYDQANGD
jgi:CBS domain-containing protein